MIPALPPLARLPWRWIGAVVVAVGVGVWILSLRAEVRTLTAERNVARQAAELNRQAYEDERAERQRQVAALEASARQAAARAAASAAERARILAAPSSADGPLADVLRDAIRGARP